VRCEQNSIFAGPVSGRVRTLVLETMHIYRSINSRTLLKGEVRNSLKFLQAAQRRGANLPHPTVHYNASFLVIFVGCTLVGCKLPPRVLLALEVTPGLLAGAEPDTHQINVMIV
jgi:hypothetical protein